MIDVIGLAMEVSRARQDIENLSKLPTVSHASGEFSREGQRSRIVYRVTADHPKAGERFYSIAEEFYDREVSQAVHHLGFLNVRIQSMFDKLKAEVVR